MCLFEVGVVGCLGGWFACCGCCGWFTCGIIGLQAEVTYLAEGRVMIFFFGGDLKREESLVSHGTHGVWRD